MAGCRPAVYNAACLYAPTASARHVPSDKAAKDAATLLRLAVTDPACELGRPSEWIGADPTPPEPPCTSTCLLYTSDAADE